MSGKVSVVPSASTTTVRQRWAAASRKQRALAGALAAIAGGACVVAANLEDAPITGRKQLIFGVYKPVTNISDNALPPKLVEPGQSLAAKRPAAVLRTAGLQLMDTCSTAIVEAMADLAASDSALQRQLSFIPDTVDLSHSLHLESKVFSGSIDADGERTWNGLPCWTFAI